VLRLISTITSCDKPSDAKRVLTSGTKNCSKTSLEICPVHPHVVGGGVGLKVNL